MGIVGVFFDWLGPGRLPAAGFMTQIRNPEWAALGGTEPKYLPSGTTRTKLAGGKVVRSRTLTMPPSLPSV